MPKNIHNTAIISDGAILDGDEINNEIENVDDNKEVIETEDTNEPDSVLITSVKKKVTPWDTYRKIIDNEWVVTLPNQLISGEQNIIVSLIGKSGKIIAKDQISLFGKLFKKDGC